MIGILLATLGALWLVLQVVTVWAVPPSTGPRRRLPMFGSPEAGTDLGPDDDDAWHHHGDWSDHAGDAGGHGGDAGGHAGD